MRKIQALWILLLLTSNNIFAGAFESYQIERRAIITYIQKGNTTAAYACVYTAANYAVAAGRRDHAAWIYNNVAHGIITKFYEHSKYTELMGLAAAVRPSMRDAYLQHVRQKLRPYVKSLSTARELLLRAQFEDEKSSRSDQERTNKIKRNLRTVTNILTAISN